ncbi:MAG: OmpA family protein [Myxococcota bacterium]
MKFEHLLLTVAVAASGACATHTPIPYQAPVSATPPTGNVAISQAVNLFDASGSQELTFATGKAALESIVGVMPNGSYQAGNINFGGFDREATGISTFNRSSLAAAAKGATHLGGSTPLFAVLERDLASALGSGKAAVVLISDGLATNFAGSGGMDARTVAAASAVAAGRSGATCFHTVQTGNDASGAALLQSIANVSSCGSFRNASALSSASALQQFSRDVYLGGAAPAPPPRPAPAPTRAPISRPVDGDSDSDGVRDSADRCPNTLRNANVDNRGCWRLRDLRFSVNGAAIESGYTNGLQEAIEVLQANPGVRIRVDGHTDSDGSENYNQGLSVRRAASVRDYLVSNGGLSAGRFEVRGFGESRPAVPNDSRENKRINRRVELTIID